MAQAWNKTSHYLALRRLRSDKAVTCSQKIIGMISPSEKALGLFILRKSCNASETGTTAPGTPLKAVAGRGK